MSTKNNDDWRILKFSNKEKLFSRNCPQTDKLTNMSN